MIRFVKNLQLILSKFLRNKMTPDNCFSGHSQNYNYLQENYFKGRMSEKTSKTFLTPNNTSGNLHKKTTSSQLVSLSPGITLRTLNRPEEHGERSTLSGFFNPTNSGQNLTSSSSTNSFTRRVTTSQMHSRASKDKVSLPHLQLNASSHSNNVSAIASPLDASQLSSENNKEEKFKWIMEEKSKFVFQRNKVSLAKNFINFEQDMQSLRPVEVLEFLLILIFLI